MNPYKILQVDRDAEPEVIEAAYRRLVAKYHPDRNDSPEAGAMLRDLNAAYELVSDPERRAHYDREWANGRGSRRASQAPHDDDGEDETPNRVMLNVLVAGAVLTLLVYQPRLGATLVGLSALIWLAWKYALITAVVGRSVLALLVLVVLGFAVRYWLEERRATTELRGLDLKTLFAAKLREQSQRCMAQAPARVPPSAAFCQCLAEAIRSHFDFSPVNVDTAADFRAAVSTRFEHALPSDEARAACLAH